MSHTEANLHCGKRWKHSVFWIVSAFVILILLTRMITLTHNRQLHPDEHVFYHTVYNLVNSILHPDIPFVENKEYPEGTYYFQLPFQFAGQMMRTLLGIEGTKGLQHFGRISSVFYFAIAVCLGMRLLWRYLGKQTFSLVLYGLTMVFSLFFIEQSRYGTGDMVSMMLLMLLMNLTARAMESSGKYRWWVASFFVSGILGAVKYPQLVFVLIPLAAALSRSGLRKIKPLALFLLAVIGGFFLFSPKAILDPAYVLRVIQRESGAYAQSSHDMGGSANHLLTLGLYLLLYSDFPLLPLLTLGGLAWPFLRLFKTRGKVPSPEGTALLFDLIIPGVCLFFFVYNLFVPVLFFRTLTPFFTILPLYTVKMAQAVFFKNKGWKTAVILLTGCMVLRGMVFLWILSDDSKVQDRMSSMISAAVDENWKETWYTCLFSFPVSQEQEGVETHSYHFVNPLVTHNDGLEIQPGQLVITGAQEFYLGQDYLLPVGKKAQKPIQLWQDFKEANHAYLLGQLYPDAYYYLFGGWLRYGTLSQYEFPCHYIYYRSR